MRPPDPTVRPPRALAVLLSAALLMSGACGPTDDVPAADAPDVPAAPGTPGETAPAAAADAFVDGPDLWLAPLTYGETGTPILGTGRNVTNRAGYDNQPKFFPDGSILYTRGVGDRTDIWRYDPATDIHAAVTETPDQSEYSATPTPDGTGFSAIVVEPDSLQRLWRFDLDGSDGAPLFEDIAPVGYHAWLDDAEVGMFVLGDPATLQTAIAGAAGPGETIDEDIGRSLNRVPDRTAITYPVRVRSGPGQAGSGAPEWEIRMLTASTDEPAPLRLLRIPSQDHAWAGGRIVYGRGHRLMAVVPLTMFDAPAPGDAPVAPAPVEIGALPDTTMVISRLAVSDDGTSIVLVVDRPQN